MMEQNSEKTKKMKDTIREKLNKIEQEIRKSKDYWRFNYSVGLSSGGCYGSGYTNESKLKNKKNDKTRKDINKI